MAMTDVVVVCLAVVLDVVVCFVVEVVGLFGSVDAAVEVVGSFVKLNIVISLFSEIFIKTSYLHSGEKLTSSIAMSESPGEPTVASMTTWYFKSLRRPTSFLFHLLTSICSIPLT